MSSTNEPTLNKNQESQKGYWTDGESRGLQICVSNAVVSDGKKAAASSRISLSSAYWYRVQNFDLPETSAEDAWRVIRSTLKECGRTLVLHAPPLWDEDPEGDAEDVTPIDGVHYEVPYLSAKQVDQIYYLLKHNLTTVKMRFNITHSISFDARKGVLAPSKRKRRRKKKTTQPSPPRWQTVGEGKKK